MSDRDASDAGDPSPVQTWVVWGMLLASVLAYLGVALFLNASRQPPPGFSMPSMLQGTVPLLPAALGFVSISTLGLAVFFRRSDVMGEKFAANLISWAMAESVAIYGLVLHVLSYEMTWFWPFWGAGFVALLAFYPRELKTDGSRRKEADANQSSGTAW
ncbi:MAG: hypothetical protein ABEL76_17525 [Bradymonadaceae bacterium]